MMENKNEQKILQQDRNSHDFYFSKKHYEHMKQTERYSMGNPEMAYTPVYFKGMVYTEMITKGKEPVTSHFGDLVHLGAGTYEDVSFTAPPAAPAESEGTVFAEWLHTQYLSYRHKRNGFKKNTSQWETYDLVMREYAVILMRFSETYNIPTSSFATRKPTNQTH